MTHSGDSSGVGSVAGEGVKPEAGPDADIDQGIEALRAPAADEEICWAAVHARDEEPRLPDWGQSTLFRY